MGKEQARVIERNSLSSFAKRVRREGALPLLREFTSPGSPYTLKRAQIELPGRQNMAAEYVLSKGFNVDGTTEQSSVRKTICILPGVFESVYSYMPTLQALEEQFNVVIVNYSQFPDLQTQSLGTKKLLEENLGIKNVFFYGTSLGGLLMQHTALEIMGDPESGLHIDGIIGSHTVDINYHSLADVRYKLVSLLPEDILWNGFNFSSIRRARRELSDTLAENATDDEALAHYFSQVTNDYKVNELASHKELARNYLRLFREAITHHTHRRGKRTISTELLRTIPKLDIYSDGDTVLKRHGDDGGLVGDDVRKIKIEGNSGHYNHKSSHMKIVPLIGEFVSAVG